MQKIYIVEDDDSIRDMLAYALSTSGFAAVGFSDSGEFWRKLETETPSLILLDIMLPLEDGISILSRLKSTPKQNSIPVIMLTAKGTEYDRIRGLDSGADDYITKPFSIMEVLSRVKAVLRRCESGDSEPHALRVENVSLQSEKRIVLVDGLEKALTYKEFELLHYLMLNVGIVLTRDRLLEQVWGFDYNGESRTVDMHIRTLRQKLGSGGAHIKTVRNVGYKIGG